MNATPSSRVCPECGLVFSGTAGSSGCPRCVLRLALAATGVEGEEVGEAAIGTESVRVESTRIFGDYEILGEIARGGMGVVYRARQLGLNRIVALKMVQSSHLLSNEARLRFRFEIEAVAQLHHPHIVSLYESGEQDGAHFFTMRLVEGGDLVAYLERGPGLSEVVRLLVKVCRAVHYAHQRGILHRDLKPSNILVDGQGEPHVADFGLAKPVDEGSGFTFSSSVLGSPSYMAPEQAAGRARQLTTAVDVYGLGAVLYHVLTGVPPFRGGTPIETLRQVLDQDPAAPRSLNPRVDSDLATIAMKCLQKAPASRYGSAEELAQDLGRWLEGVPIQARPLGWAATAWRWSRRHPLAASLGAALGVALAGVVVATSVAAVRVRQAEKRAEAQMAKALVSEARALRLRGPWSGRREGMSLLREASRLGVPEELRSRAREELLAFAAFQDLEFVPAVSSKPSSLWLSRIDPRLAWVAEVEHGTSIVVRSTGGVGEEVRVHAGPGEVQALDRFSGDGRYLSVRYGDRRAVWEWAQGRLCWSRPGSNVVMAFSPAGSEFVVQESPNEAVFRELPSGRELRRWRLPPDRPGGRQSGWHTLVISPNGRTVAGASVISKIVEWMDAGTGEVVRLMTNGARTTAMAWSPDGKHFVVTCGDGKTYAWNMPRDREPRVSPNVMPLSRAVGFHPSGRHLLLAGEDRRVRMVDWASLQVVHEMEAEGGDLGVGADGRRWGPVWAESRWGWMEERIADTYREFDAGVVSGRVMDIRFSADDRFLLAGNPQAVSICDPEAGVVLLPLPSWIFSTTVFQPGTHALVTANTPGILRFEPLVHSDLRSLGTPENIHVARRWRALDFTADGRFLAGFNGASNAVFVFDQSLTNVVSSFGPHGEAEEIAISPDGRWVATSSYDDRSVKVWDVSGRRLVFLEGQGTRPRAAFSRERDWLVTFGEGLVLRKAGSWKVAPPLPFSDARTLPGPAAFSPDGRILAVVGDSTRLHLFDLERFEDMGVLRPRETALLRSLAFSGSGGRLAAINAEGRVMVWRLDRIRSVLEEAGLASGAWRDARME